jgi:hypothetical protein
MADLDAARGYSDTIVFAPSHALDHGGGIYNSGGRLSVTSCEFSNNSASMGGPIDEQFSISFGTPRVRYSIQSDSDSASSAVIVTTLHALSGRRADRPCQRASEPFRFGV